MWVGVDEALGVGGLRGGKKHTLSHLFTYPGELTSDMESGARGER